VLTGEGNTMYINGWGNDTIREVSLELTYNCSLDCKFCSSNARCISKIDNESNIENILDYDVVSSIMCQGRYELGAYRISFSGGEPLLHPHFLKILGLSDILGFQEKLIYTSGSFVYNDEGEKEDGAIFPIPYSIIKKIASSKTKPIMIFDIQGCDEKEVDDIMGIDGAFENMVESIRRCKEFGLRVEGHFVPMRPNLCRLFDTLYFAKDIGVKRISLLRWVAQGRSKEEESRWRLSKSEFEDLQHMMIQIENNNFLPIRVGHPIDFRFLVDSSYPIERCRGGMSDPLFQPLQNGNARMIMCPAFKELNNYLAGEVDKRTSIKELWNNETYNIFREFIYGEMYKQIEGKCKDCVWLSLCRGGCTASRLIETNKKGYLPLRYALLKGSDPMCFYNR